MTLSRIDSSSASLTVDRDTRSLRRGLVGACLLALSMSIPVATASASTIAFSFSDDASASIFGRTHVSGTVTGLMYGLDVNGSNQLPTSILFTSNVDFVGITNPYISAVPNSFVFGFAAGLNLSNGSCTSGGFSLNFDDPSTGGKQLSLNGNPAGSGGGYNLLQWNGGSGPFVGTGNQNGTQGLACSVYVDPNTPSVPEPGTLALLGLGLVGLRFTRRRTA